MAHTIATPAVDQIGRFALVIVLGLAAAANAKAAEATYSQRMACTPDAFRVCSSEMPDSDAMKGCMIANKTSLSVGYLATFQKNVVNR